MVPLKNSAAANADQLEVQAIRAAGHGRSTVVIPLEDCLIDEVISDEGEEANWGLAGASADVDSFNDASRRDTEVEGALADVRAVLAERRRVLGGLYPFDLLPGGGVLHRGGAPGVYEFCLGLSTVTNVGLPRFRAHLAKFERIVGGLVGQWLGSGACFLRTGYPQEALFRSREPNSFESWVEMMRGRLPEETWELDATSVNGAEADGGVDALIWRPLEDGRAGQLLFAVNCGCGKNWYEQRKYRERPSASLLQKLRRPRGAFVDLFALPFHVVDVNQWRAAVAEGGWVLDRLRLTLLSGFECSAGNALEGCLGEPMDEVLRSLVA